MTAPSPPAPSPVRAVWIALLVLWAAAVWWLSSQSDPGDSLGLPFQIPDKLAHGIEFAVGGFLAHGTFRVPGSRRSLVVAVLVCGGWGVVDEWHQGFVPGRDTSGWDVLADGTGAALGALICGRVLPDVRTSAGSDGSTENARGTR